MSATEMIEIIMVGLRSSQELSKDEEERTRIQKVLDMFAVVPC